MKWMSLRVQVDSEMVAAVSDIMARYGQGGAVTEEEIDDSGHKLSIVNAYLPLDRSYKAAKLLIMTELSKLRSDPAKSLSETILKKEDWLDSLKAHFGILEIGDGLVIKPTWSGQPILNSRRIIIELDPGEAFGTGWHPTTRLCLLRLEKLLLPGTSVLDLGTGTGILAIVAAKLGARSITALDTDPSAVAAATINAKMNGVDNRISIRRGTLSRRFQNNHVSDFDLVLANINPRTIAEFPDAFRRVMKTGARLILSGIGSQGLDEILIRLALADFRLEDLDCDGEWRAVIASKG